MSKKLSLLFLSVILLLSFTGLSTASASEINNVTEHPVYQDEPTNVSDYLKSDFINSLKETKNPDVRIDESGNIYTFKKDGSIEIQIMDVSTARQFTGNASINCIACVGGVKVTLRNSGSKYDTYTPWVVGVQGSYPLTLNFSKTIGWANSYTGSLTAKVKDLSATAGINVTASGSYTAGATLPLKPGQTGQIKYRSVYKNQKVIQTTTIGNSSPVTTNLVAKGFHTVQYQPVTW
jgi:hypothetical protein